MFEVGDVVVCVDAGEIRINGHRCFGAGLTKGAVYRVWSLGINPISAAPVLHFSPPVNNNGSAQVRFRKVKPASAKFTAQMRALKPAPQIHHLFPELEREEL